MSQEIDEDKVNELFTKAQKELTMAEEDKKSAIINLASNLEQLGMEKRKISSEIKKRLVDAGFVSAGYVRMCLNPEQKDESKVTIKSKVRNSNAQLVAHTTTGQTVTPEPPTRPEPVYNQGQTVEPEQLIDETKAPDQGIIPDTVEIPEEKLYNPEIDALQKELSTANAKILELSQKQLLNDALKERLDDTLEENSSLREQLKNRIVQPSAQEQGELRYPFPLEEMRKACVKHIAEGSKKAYIIVRNGKITAIRAVLPS